MARDPGASGPVEAYPGEVEKMAHLSRREFLGTVGAGAVALATPDLVQAMLAAVESDAATGVGTSKRPNIIVILADDMGFSDIGAYGAEVHTPNIDGLARGGIRFTQMYNCARCSPSRASLLTGLYPHQAGVGSLCYDLGHPSYQGYLNDRCVTIAEVLRTAGYKTLMVGKWHIGGAYSLPKEAAWRPGTPGFPTPITRGFDRFYGTLAGAGNYYNPYSLMRDDKLVHVGRDEDYYYTDAISDNAVGMIEESVREAKPFFLYVSYTAPHWPLHARPRDIAKYAGKYRRGWDALRAERYERLKGSRLVDPKWKLSPRDKDIPPWSQVDRKHREWYEALMGVYAAQIDSMDQGIGRILKALERTASRDNTIIMFLSDNGADSGIISDSGYILGNRRPARDGRPMQVGNVLGRIPGPEDVFMSFGLHWANASNTPFRRYKCWTHEGGIATPLIVNLPSRAHAGTVHRDPVHLIDLSPTILALAGAEYPEQHGGKAILPAEGESFAPLLRGQRWARRRPILWEHQDCRAVRTGEWKLVSGAGEKWELYNLNEDRTELNDLAASDKARVAEMAKRYDEWAKRCGVLTRAELRRLRSR